MRRKISRKVGSRSLTNLYDDLGFAFYQTGTGRNGRILKLELHDCALKSLSEGQPPPSLFCDSEESIDLVKRFENSKKFGPKLWPENDSRARLKWKYDSEKYITLSAPPWTSTDCLRILALLAQ